MQREYNKPVAGRSLTNTIVNGFKTPKIKVRFSNVVHPFFYANAPEMPRYSLTCVLDAEENKKFIEQVLEIERREGTPTQFKNELKKQEDGSHIETGNHLLKFQLRENVPVMKIVGNRQPEPVKMTDEFPSGAVVEVVFDITRYVNKMTNKPGITCKGTTIYWHMDEVKSNDLDEESPF